MLSEGLLGATPWETAGPHAKGTVDGVQIRDPTVKKMILFRELHQ